MSNTKLKNPWKGLDFYEEGEILYGRNLEIQNLSQYIFNNTQTVLFGRSGIGKSSILNAGIFPKARVMGMVPVPIRLKHDNSICYLQQIKQEIEKCHICLKEIVPAIDLDTETLWEFMHRFQFVSVVSNEVITPLFVFDQFEEIFTLQNKEVIKRKFFSELADLLNDIKPLYIIEHERKQSTYNSSRLTTPVDHGIFKGLNLSLNLKKEENDSINSNVVKYIANPDYHIVFALREDFLSSLEMYASNIPVMKNNRFGLLPINEEQAADIIMLPQQGLVEKDVAALIIQKVTERTDFELDGKPEIEVEAAILSLYLSRLYDEKEKQDTDKITFELVERVGANVIQNFYEESIAPLIPKKQEVLEELLLTVDGHRDNVSRSDFLASGFTEEDVDYLVDKVKILRQFSMRADLRLELIHDILCPIILSRKDKRIQYIMIEKERKAYETKIRKQKNRYKFLTLIFAVLATFAILFGVYIYGQNSQIPVNVQIKESENIKDNDFWRIKLEILCGDDTLCVDTLDKVNTSMSFAVQNSMRHSKLDCRIIPLIGNIHSVSSRVSLSESQNIVLIVEPNTKEQVLFGKIHVSSGSAQPVMGAIVVWGNQVTKTSRTGQFSFNEPSDYKFNKESYRTIKIIKEGYKLTERIVQKNGSVYTFDLENKDDFYKRCKEYENIDTSKCKKLVFEANYLMTKSLTLVVNCFFMNDSTIQGYYYNKNAYLKRKKKESIYILFHGKITNEANIELSAIDDAYNKRTIVAKFYNNYHTIKGEAFSSEKLYDFTLNCEHNLKQMAEKAQVYKVSNK